MKIKKILLNEILKGINNLRGYNLFLDGCVLFVTVCVWSISDRHLHVKA